MFKRSTWLHLRIPFSFFLLPVFLFALSLSPNLNANRLWIVFVSLHFFLYPASNGYNSYFDRDEESIGGLRNPPPVARGLYYTALVFDLIALVLAALINMTYVVMLMIYGLVSKAYSHPSIRIKKYPYLSWFIAGLFQGFFTFLTAFSGLNDFGIVPMLNRHTLIPALLTSLILWGSYPMTQIYQHREDKKRGDTTLSLRLGISGTFHFTAIVFTLAAGSFCWYFAALFSMKFMWGFLLALVPVLLYFFYWYALVRKDPSAADHRHTMRLNFISALCLAVFFIYFFLENSQIMQAIRAGY